MDLSKFTERARGFIQAAQTIAIREHHQRILPEHVLKALLDDDQGFASNLIARSGGDAKSVRDHVATTLSKLPKVDGGAQAYIDNQTVKVIGEARTSPKKQGINLSLRNAF